MTMENFTCAIFVIALALPKQSNMLGCLTRLIATLARCARSQ